MESLPRQLNILTRCLEALLSLPLCTASLGTGHSSLTKMRDIPFDNSRWIQGLCMAAASNDTYVPFMTPGLGLAKKLGIKNRGRRRGRIGGLDFLRSTGSRFGPTLFIAENLFLLC